MGLSFTSFLTDVSPSLSGFYVIRGSSEEDSGMKWCFCSKSR